MLTELTEQWPTVQDVAGRGVREGFILGYICHPRVPCLSSDTDFLSWGIEINLCFILVKILVFIIRILSRVKM